jgi:hypothetical protein
MQPADDGRRHRSLWESVMPNYRAYVVTDKNHIEDAPAVISCDDDNEAIQRALPLVNATTLSSGRGCGL